jgi:hypothetical protein
MFVGAKFKQCSPSPAQRRSEDTAQERTNDSSDHENTHPDANQQRSTLRCNRKVYDQNGAAQCSRAATSLDSSPDDQGYRVWGCGGDDASNQVQDKSTHVGNGSWEICEQLPPGCTGSSDENEASCTIPCDLVQRVEVVGDRRNGCSYNPLSFGVSTVLLQYAWHGRVLPFRLLTRSRAAIIVLRLIVVMIATSLKDVE